MIVGSVPLAYRPGTRLFRVLAVVTNLKRLTARGVYVAIYSLE